LLARGDWYFESGNAVTARSWFRFTPSSTGAAEGTFDIADASCPDGVSEDQCPDLRCAGTDGRYQVTDVNRLTLESPCDGTSETYISYFLSLDPGLIAPALVRYNWRLEDDPTTNGRGVARQYETNAACDAAFTSCGLAP
jgi:hypothetical protein